MRFAVEYIYIYIFRHAVVDRFVAHFADDAFMDTMLTKLQGLCLHGENLVKTRFYNHLLARTSDQLRSLHVDTLICAPQKGFANLIEICIYNATFRKISCIMRTVKVLRRFHLEFISQTIHKYSEDYMRLEDELISMMSFETLENISIKMDRHIGAVKRAIERTVFRKSTKMRVHLYIKHEIEDAHEYLDTLTKKLKATKKDFILRFRCVVTESMIGKVPNCQSLEQMGEILRITRTNGECTLHGYAEQWLYPCACNNV